MTIEQTTQSFMDLIRSLEENGIGDDAPIDNVFSLFGDNITDLTPANFYAAFGGGDTLTAKNGVYRLIRNVDGSVRALNFTDNWGQMAQVESLESYLNSNAQIPTYDPTTSFTYTKSTNISPNLTDPTTVNLTGGVSNFVGNVLQSQKHVTASGLLSAIPFAAGIGVRLGKAIDSGLYKLLDVIGANPPEELNPETWGQVAQQDDFAGWAFRTLFDIDPATNGVTQYMDAEAVAYMSLWLKEQGFFNTGETSYPDYKTRGTEIITSLADINTMISGALNQVPQGIVFSPDVGTAINNFISSVPSDSFISTYVWASANPAWTGAGWSPLTIYVSTDHYHIGSEIRLGSAIPCRVLQTRGVATGGGSILIDQVKTTTTSSYSTFVGSGPQYPGDYYRKSSNINTVTSPAIPGVTDNGGRVPDVTTWSDPAATLQSLRQQYPEWWDNRIEETITNPDGTTKTYTYIPFTLPNEQTDGNPDTQTNDPDELEVEPETATQTKLQTLIELLTNQSTNTLVDPTTSTQTGTNDTNPTSNSNPPDTGTGDGLPIVLPTGSASSLWAVYHPSQSQLNAFGAWLWSSDFVEQLKRLFNDPMQAIIGVHKVFAPIPTGGTSTIKCGFLDSGVSSPTVSSQYTEVDCGSVSCSEYFGSVFDYDPHTKVSIYLPFIGVVPLKVSEVMRSTISVSYGVDVITGACLAKVKVTRDNAGGILYSYGGSCACHYPISSGSYAGIISGIVTSAMGIAGGIVAGNPLAAIGGAVAGLRQSHTDIQRSGGFTGCAGAMGPKIPYLIIDRPQTRMAADFEKYAGKPSNATQFIGDCSGFIRAKEIHFSAPGAFDEEAKEVEALLKSGVLLSD